MNDQGLTNMHGICNIEIINISTKEGKLVALISYQEKSRIGEFPNDGYDTIEVPVNLRDIRLSSRGNTLVDQSVKEDIDVPNLDKE